MNETLLSNHPGLMALFRRLKCFTVDWAPGYDNGLKDHDLTTLDRAEVTSSELATVDLDGNPASGRHIVALDIDHPAWLVKSTTKGHSHLYIDIPGGVAREDYFELLRVLARCGVIEPGYAGASIARGRTFLRLPWVKKPAA